MQCFWRQNAEIRVLLWQAEVSKHAVEPELPVPLMGGLGYFLYWYVFFETVICQSS